MQTALIGQNATNNPQKPATPCKYRQQNSVGTVVALEFARRCETAETGKPLSGGFSNA
jgi:hypothetical protein